MKYDRKDLPKIIALSMILIALLVYIGVVYSQSRAKMRADMERHRAGHAQEAASAAAGAGRAAAAPSVSPLVTALLAPVPPPDRDPFDPVIPPRSQYTSAPAPASSRPSRTEAPSELPLLPPVSEGSGPFPSSRTQDVLTLSGIILGPPSLAVLRRGEEHFIVKAGDQIAGRLRVQSISRDTVTLRDARREYVLRLGG